MGMKRTVHREIIEGRQGHILGAPDTQFFKGLQNAEGHDTVADEDRCGPRGLLQDVFSEPVPGIVSEISFEDSASLNRNIRLTKGFLVAAKTLTASLQIQGTGDDGNAAVPLLNHVAHALARTADIVQQDSIGLDTGYGTVQTYESHAGVDGSCQVTYVCPACRRQQDAIDAVGTKRRDYAPFAADLFIRVGRHQKVAAFEGRIFRAADDLRKEGIRNVRQDHGEHTGLSDLQASRDLIWRVVQVSYGGPHTFGQLGADGARPADDIRDRGDGDARSLRYFNNRRHALMRESFISIFGRSIYATTLSRIAPAYKRQFSL
jgi:hypothetical protein